MRHIVLLGDSIFDNAAYVEGGPDVVAHLRGMLPPGDRATLLAVDGSVTADVASQLARVPADATHLVLSVGGNDALAHIGILQRPARVGGQVLDWMARAVAPFAASYRDALARMAALGRPTVVCTIYDGQLEPEIQPAARAAVAVYNDAIQRAARAAGMPVIELRDICVEPGDYANPIEPSVQGGRKIARAILRAVDS